MSEDRPKVRYPMGWLPPRPLPKMPTRRVMAIEVEGQLPDVFPRIRMVFGVEFSEATIRLIPREVANEPDDVEWSPDRVDDGGARLIAEVTRLCTRYRKTDCEQERGDIRRLLHAASTPLGMWELSTQREQRELARNTFREDLAGLIRSGREAFRKHLDEGEGCATEAALRKIEEFAKSLLDGWKSIGGEPNWEMIRHESSWTQLFSRVQDRPGQRVAEKIASELLGIARNRVEGDDDDGDF